MHGERRQRLEAAAGMAHRYMAQEVRLVLAGVDRDAG
jgi:hypothetical protein